MKHSHAIAESLLVHADFVRRLAAQLAGQDGDDLAQDALTAAFASDHGGVREARGWLATIVQNIGRNRQRSRNRHARRLATVSAPLPSPSVDQILVREEVRRRVVDAVVALPEPLRAVVLLHFYEGLDSGAIGRRLGAPASTIRSRLQQALARLRVRLDAEHGSRRDAWALPLAGWCGPAAALRVAWGARAALAVAALLLVAWLASTMRWSSPPSPPPVTPIDERVASDRPPLPERDAAAPERDAAPIAAAAADSRGPGVLWGRVVAAEGAAPIVGADVRLEHRPADESMAYDAPLRERVELVGAARSDELGRFVFDVARGRQHRLVVSAPGFAKSVTGYCCGGTEYVVRLARPAAVAGSVRTASGAPLADVRVEVVLQGSPLDSGASTRTGADGGFLIGELPPGTSYVVARPPGLAAAPLHTLQLEPGVVAQVELTVPRGRHARGVVRDLATGLPIIGAEVSTGPQFGGAVRTDSDGAYLLGGLDERAQFFVRAAGYGTRLVELATGSGDVACDVELLRGVSLTGRVVSAERTPIVGARVAAVADQTRSVGSFTHWRGVDSAADGSFTIEGLSARFQRLDGVWVHLGWQLTARAAGHGARVIAVPIDPDGSTQIDVGDVVLPAAAGLEGRVVDEFGAPLAGAEVRLNGVGDGFAQLLAEDAHLPTPHWAVSHRNARSDPDGVFRFADIGPGSYEVRVEVAEGALEQQSGPHAVAAGAILVIPDVVITRGLTIRGALRAAPGLAPLDGQRIVVTAFGDQTRTVRVAADGTFCITQLPAGRYTVAVSVPPPGLAVAPVAGVAAGASGVDLVLVDAERITGRVVDGEGRPVQRASVAFFATGVTSAKNWFTDAEGRFAVEVPPGATGHLSVMHPDEHMRQTLVEDVQAGARDVEITLPKR